jgi:2-polyprenyl-6-methoxyphenol hydroxylase-like FAD-dependent oxidoreductase
MSPNDSTNSYLQSDGHAVVIGAGMAGLLAARVLSDHFRKVTVIERDSLLDLPEARKGAPQGRHVHALLVRGQQILGQLFPGLVHQLIAQGAPAVRLGRDLRWFHFGCWKKNFASDLTSLAVSRPALELEVRRRVVELPNVTIIDGAVVTRYTADWENARLTGVCIRGRSADMPEDSMHADLVVDASGRGSQTPQRLSELGYVRPEEALVNVDHVYASRVYERPARAPDWKHLYVMDRPPSSRGGIVYSIEGHRWMVTLVGAHGDHPPTDEAGFLEYARSLPVPDVHAAIANARPLGAIVAHAFPSGRRRYYERLTRFPIGLIVLGDALCSFNPVYGQGVTVSALEAKLLDDCLRELVARRTPNLDALTANFRQRVAGVVALPWQLATTEDLRFPQTPGRRSWTLRLMHWYLERLHEAAGVSERVARRFYAVSNLLAPRRQLFSREMIADVLRVAKRRERAAPGVYEPSSPSLPQRDSRAA